jgi:hypothetical protein
LTRRQAELELAQLAVTAGAEPATPHITLGELVDLHLAEHTTLAATTRADYESVIRLLPEDALDIELAKVTPAWLDSIQARLAALGWSKYRIVKFRNVIGPALRRARRWDWIRVNPLEAVPARGAGPFDRARRPAARGFVPRPGVARLAPPQRGDRRAPR